MFINVTHGSVAERVSRKGCVAAGCTTAVNCPSVLWVKAAGTVVGCESACARFGTDQYCCRGAWASRSACNPAQWPVDYAAVFKKAEPYAYSYADDDATSTFVCKGRSRLSCCTLLLHRLSLKRQGLTLGWVDPSLERHGVVVPECMWPI
jgi:Thaumatin family